YMAKNRDQYEATGSRDPHLDLKGQDQYQRASQAGLGNFLNECIGRSTRERGDNVALGTLHQQMMADRHRMAILDPEAHLLGIGIARIPNRFYVTEVFGK